MVALGEKVAATYLRRHGFSIGDRNIARKTGELDLIAAEEGNTLYFVEVKTILVDEFPEESDKGEGYDPSLSLSEAKIREVVRTGEWYVLEKKWGVARVRRVPRMATP